MRRAKTRPASSPPSPGPVASMEMYLYIADGAPNSQRAVVNLAAICKEHLGTGFRLEVIDVLKFPVRALADGILVTPCLTKMSPAPSAKIVGNLSDTDGVLRALGIRD